MKTRTVLLVCIIVILTVVCIMKYSEVRKVAVIKDEFFITNRIEVEGRKSRDLYQFRIEMDLQNHISVINSYLPDTSFQYYFLLFLSENNCLSCFDSELKEIAQLSHIQHVPLVFFVRKISIVTSIYPF